MIKSLLLATALALLPITAIAQESSTPTEARTCVPVTESMKADIQAKFHVEYNYFPMQQVKFVVVILRSNATTERGVTEVLVLLINTEDGGSACVMDQGFMTPNIEKLARDARDKAARNPEVVKGPDVNTPAGPPVTTPEEGAPPAPPTTDMPKSE